MANSISENEGPLHYVKIDKGLCNGCVVCMKACPTKAIRVKKDGMASIDGVCIDCGECVRVCPRGAIKAITAESYDPKVSPFSTISASPVLFTQFGEDVMPNDVLLALRKMGFRYVHDQSYTNEMINFAIELHIRENRRKQESPWPLISPVCPVVVRLILNRFPSLLRHIPPLATPREIVAREAKKRLAFKYGCSQEEIKVFYITPCLAKMISIKEPVLHHGSYLDGAIGIGNIYEAVKKNIRELDLDEDKVLHHSGGVGLGWSMSGGEVAGLEMDCLAVSGLQETIRYLEKIEMGLLQGIEYVEFRTCTEGCLGGPLTVADKYQAKYHLQRLVRMFGVEKRVKAEYVKNLYEKGWFFTDRKDNPPERKLFQGSISNGIERQNRIEEILRLLPGKECGLCGSPDCRTFAEDVVEGKDSLESCIFLEKKKKGDCR
jgi:iron only hydrogenase large subunit-like protein